MVAYSACIGFLIPTCLHCFSSTCFVCSWSSARSLSLFSRFFSFSRFFILYIKIKHTQRGQNPYYFHHFPITLGRRDCAVRLPPMWQARVRFRLGATCGLSLLLLLRCSEGFCLGSLVFPPPQKTTFPNSISTRIIKN